MNIQINFDTFQSSHSVLIILSENCEGRDFPLYTPLLQDEDVLTTDFLGRRVQLNFVEALTDTWNVCHIVCSCFEEIKVIL